jgi:hypothetical protein
MTQQLSEAMAATTLVTDRIFVALPVAMLAGAACLPPVNESLI